MLRWIRRGLTGGKTAPFGELKQTTMITIPTAKSYTIYSESGAWLGQIVLTSDGLFASVTDYGNLSYAWRSYVEKDFRAFICSLNIDYFAAKVYQGNTYILYSKKCEAACKRFAEMILPPLQKALRAEIDSEKEHPEAEKFIASGGGGGNSPLNPEGGEGVCIPLGSIRYKDK